MSVISAHCWRIAREFGGRRSGAAILTRPGDIRRTSGYQQQAREAWQQALDILRCLQGRPTPPPPSSCR
jgi:hypothetical protein